ncbi:MULTISPECIES: hypothetical protein [Streptomyces]|uniref:hypothetical protein n=1 Tax=Streptomyces TaxID=1883 RepID=UPI001489E379|nr:MULTISPECIES: hypothetical protein [Streptomyces]
MQTIRAKRDASDADLRLVLAGAATAIGGIGALLALIGSDSPLRGPFTLFFLLAAPAVAIAAALDGLDPLGRAIVALAGAIVVDMLVAQGLLALHLWSVRGGIAAVTVLSALTLLLVLVRRSGGRTARRGGP